MAIQKHPDKVTAQNLGVEWVGGVVDLHHLLKRANIYLSVFL